MTRKNQRPVAAELHRRVPVDVQHVSRLRNHDRLPSTRRMAGAPRRAGIRARPTPRFHQRPPRANSGHGETPRDHRRAGGRHRQATTASPAHCPCAPVPAQSGQSRRCSRFGSPGARSERRGLAIFQPRPSHAGHAAGADGEDRCGPRCGRGPPTHRTTRTPVCSAPLLAEHPSRCPRRRGCPWASAGCTCTIAVGEPSM